MNRIVTADCLEWMLSQLGGIVDLVLTSPPYEDARLYKPLEFKARGQGWVDWMIPRVVQMCRLSRGLVLVNMAGKVRDFQYSPVVEWLVADLTRNHGLVCGPAPYVFHRVGIPGSGGPHYHRRDWEPVYAFARPECLPPKWSDNTAMGHPPKWAPGGEMSNRDTNGERVNDPWGKRGRGSNIGGYNGKGERNVGTIKKTRLRRGKNGHGEPGAKGGIKTTRRVMTTSPRGSRDNGEYNQPVLANSGNVIQEHYTAEQVAALLEHGDVVKCNVGGGVMGDELCHENEAPFPERLCDFFIRSYCPEGGVVLDPFCGSGTVPKVAQRWGRNYIGVDVRESQTKLAERRVREFGQPLFA